MRGAASHIYVIALNKGPFRVPVLTVAAGRCNIRWAASEQVLGIVLILARGGIIDNVIVLGAIRKLGSTQASQMLTTMLPGPSGTKESILKGCIMWGLGGSADDRKGSRISGRGLISVRAQWRHISRHE